MKYPIARRCAGNLFFLVLIVLLHGCATPQTDSLLAARSPQLPARSELGNVPYYAQEAHQCGPATLAMAMGAAGVVIDPKALEPQVYLPSEKGSLQVEMTAATRRQGLLAYRPAPNLSAVLDEIAGGNPVIVLQNLGLSWYPVWHYAVAIGYDLERGEIMLRSGPERRQQLPLRTFERTWARSGYWALLALPPAHLPRSTDIDRYLAAAVELEQTRQTAAARKAYTTALTRWPDNFNIRMGLGNSAYALGDFAAAETAYRVATLQWPQAAVAYNNLADTLARQKKYREALVPAKRAVQLGGEQHETFEQTLREIETALQKQNRPAPTKPKQKSPKATNQPAPVKRPGVRPQS